MAGKFEGDFSNQSYPEFSPDQEEAEASREKTLRLLISSHLDGAANKAETRIRNNPNITAFGEDNVTESVDFYRNGAMFNEARQITDSLFGETVASLNMTDAQKNTILDAAAENIVRKHKSAQNGPVAQDLNNRFI